MSEESNKPTALVTGGSRGIGRAICLRLAREGYIVIINYHSRQAAADETCAAIQSEGGEAWTFRADVTDAEQVKQMFAAVREKHQRLDVLVNNAGKTFVSLFPLTAPDKFRAMYEGNVLSAVLCSQAALRIMLSRRKGVIVNITSSSALRAPVGLSAYAASKAAVNALTKALAKEVAGKGIRVNAIAPSWVETEMTEAGSDAIREKLKHLPLKRMAQPEEVAAVVAAIVRDDMSYLVGEVISLDGGGF
jgi:3-oxoacyl-[acyl-carrier protein] reductase